MSLHATESRTIESYIRQRQSLCWWRKIEGSNVQFYPQPESNFSHSAVWHRTIEDLLQVPQRHLKLFAKTISENVSYCWTDEMQSSFDALKIKWVSDPVLAYPDYWKSFFACTGALSNAVGAVLSQLEENRRALNTLHEKSILEAEINYSFSERKALWYSAWCRKKNLLCFKKNTKT